jgi:hypothetical protein
MFGSKLDHMRADILNARSAGPIERLCGPESLRLQACPTGEINSSGASRG